MRFKNRYIWTHQNPHCAASAEADPMQTGLLLSHRLLSKPQPLWRLHSLELLRKCAAKPWRGDLGGFVLLQ
jgi:hypothetical protein